MSGLEYRVEVLEVEMKSVLKRLDLIIKSVEDVIKLLEEVESQ